MGEGLDAVVDGTAGVESAGRWLGASSSAGVSGDAVEPGGPSGLVTAGVGAGDGGEGLMVSLRAEVPEALLAVMGDFIERHPSWDQYRLFQAALAGFLVQNGVQDRGVTRCYLANLFPSQRRFAALPHRPSASRGAAPHPPSRAAA